MRKNECTFHGTWRSNSKTWLLLMRSWMSKAETWMLRKSKLNVGCKKVESRMQTQMTNTKCRIDCAKYNVNWNIEDPFGVLMAVHVVPCLRLELSMGVLHKVL